MPMILFSIIRFTKDFRKGFKRFFMINLDFMRKKYQEYQINMRRYFHQNPEISGKEFNTSKIIKEELDKISVPWVSCGLETGILATIEGRKHSEGTDGSKNNVILLRADIDALPVHEATGFEWSSRYENVMHACGHDCHISMLLTAAHILNELKGEFSGTVKLAFQPAEEIDIGAKSMIDQGAAEGVDACFAIHIWSDVEAGHISCQGGPIMASTDKFSIDVKGKGGHGASPQQCVDALVVSSAIVNNLQTIVSRNIAPVDAAVVTVGMLNCGTGWNIIAENGHLEGTTRCFDMEVRERFPQLIERMATDTAKAFGAEATLNYTRFITPTVNDPDIALLVRNSSKKILGQDGPVFYKPTMAGEDFSFFLQKIPGALAFLGCRNESCGAIWPQHSGNYTVDENVLIDGALLYAQVAMDFLEKQ